MSLMASYKGHMAGGLASGIIVATAVELTPISNLAGIGGIASVWRLSAAAVVTGALFGLIPDVDTNSKAQDLFFGIAFLSDLYLIATGRFELAAYLGLIAMLPILGHHRGWTHRVWAAFAVPLAVLAAPMLYSPKLWPYALVLYAAAVADYLSHLLLDGLLIKQVSFKG